MFSSRMPLLSAAASGALALGGHGCASGGTATGFNDHSDDAGGSTGSYDDASGGGTSPGTTGTGSSTSSGTSNGPATAGGTTSGSSSGVASSGSASGGTTSSGGADAAAESCPTPSTPIDTMENGSGAIFSICGRMGYWYTYDDGTSGATLTPVPMTPFKDSAITPPRPLGDGGTSTMAAMMSGGGFTSYGAGMGFDLENPGGGAAKGTYNASTYSGVTFWAMGSAGGTVRFNVPDKATDASGGICMGSTGTSQCNDHHGHALTLTTSWQQVTFTWAQLTQQGFGYAEASLDTAHLVGMQFQVNSPTGTFDVWIDDISFTQ